MKGDNMLEFLTTYGWIPMLIIMLSMLGFFIWVIIKLLQYWSVI